MEASGRSVLIVDDDDDWRGVMADVLAEAGFAVTTANNGRAALLAWRRTKAQVVVTDVQMPIMDGCRLLEVLHSIDRSLPVIVMTAEGAVDVASTLVGAFRVIRKPTPTEAVVSAVTEALGRRPPHRARIGDAARALVSFGQAKGSAAVSRAAALLRSRKAPERPVRLDGHGRRRTRLTMVAGVGAAAAAVVLIAGFRGLIV